MPLAATAWRAKNELPSKPARAVPANPPPACQTNSRRVRPQKFLVGCHVKLTRYRTLVQKQKLVQIQGDQTKMPQRLGGFDTRVLQLPDQPQRRGRISVSAGIRCRTRCRAMSICRFRLSGAACCNRSANVPAWRFMKSLLINPSACVGWTVLKRTGQGESGSADIKIGQQRNRQRTLDMNVNTASIQLGTG